MAKPPRAKSKKARRRRAPGPQQVQSALLAELIHTIRALHEYDRAVSRQDEQRAAGALSDPGDPVTIEFTKKSGPDFVRIVMRDSRHVALAPNRPGGKSDPRRAGDKVEASIEVNGNPGDMAVITVKNALPDTVKLAVPPGETGEVGTFPLLVLG